MSTIQTLLRNTLADILHYRRVVNRSPSDENWDTPQTTIHPQRTSPTYRLMLASVVTSSCVTLFLHSILTQQTPLLRLEPVSAEVEKTKESTPKNRHLPTKEEVRTLTRIGEKISSMMNVGQTMTCKVWPDFNTDLAGRHGIFIACPEPLFTTSNEEEMKRKRSWIIFAVIAAVKYAEVNRGAVDYIAITDPLGMIGERWYYQLEMTSAAKVQRQLIFEGIGFEKAYKTIIASWHKVTANDAP